METIPVGEIRRWTICSFLLLLMATGIVKLWFAGVVFLVALVWLALTSERLASKALHLTVLRSKLLGLPLPTTDASKPGWMEAEAQAEDAIERIGNLKLDKRFFDELHGVRDVMNEGVYRITKVPLRAAGRAKAASNIARVLTRKNRKIRKHGESLQGALAEAVEGYLIHARWLCGKDGADLKLMQLRFVFEQLLEAADSGVLQCGCIRDVLETTRNYDATEDLRLARDELVAILDALTKAFEQVRADAASGRSLVA